MTESTMTTNRRVSEVLRRTIHNVLSGVAVVQAMKAPVVEVGEAGMIPVVQGVGTRVGREVGGVSNMLISITRVGRMIPEGDTSLPRHLLERRTMLTRTPRTSLIPRCMGTHPAHRLMRRTRLRRRTKTDNSTITMVGMPIHSRPRQVMRMRRRQARTPTPQHLITHSKDNTPLRLVLNAPDRRTPDRMHATMSVRTRIPT